jgi:PhzF family phenazine biosynthesis protein
MQIKTFIVDAFTREQFKGNPAGVCLLENDLEDHSMLSIAKELGLSETAFVRKTAGDHMYSIRYFSPKKEIPLCGHATLGSATVLFGKSEITDITFVTGENVELAVKKDAENGQIVMVFPVYDTTAIPVPASMLHALGLLTVIKTSYSPNNKIVLLEISDANILAALKPDFNALIKSYDGINGVLVTALSNTADFDFHYRYFWPWAGTNEDPVTGGVQTFLTKYWSQKLNKTKLKAFQSSERTGLMTTELQGDKVLVYGSAVIVLEGELKL